MSTTPLPPCEQDEPEPLICQYCNGEVDEEHERVWYTSSIQVDHYDCVPLSEKQDPGDYE
jgi:hypothetical protein